MIPMYTDAHLLDTGKTENERGGKWLDEIFTVEELDSYHRLERWTRERFDQEIVEKDGRSEVYRYLLGRLNQDDNILSVGAGYCGKEINLMKMGYVNVHCCEPTCIIKYAKSFCPDLKISICSAGKLPYPENTFDAVISNSVIYCLSDEEVKLMVLEMLRVTKNNGRVILTCGSNLSIISRISYSLRLFTPFRGPGWKRSGSLRTSREVADLIRAAVGKVKITECALGHLDHLKNKKILFNNADGDLTKLGVLARLFSTKIFSFANSINVWEFDKKEAK